MRKGRRDDGNRRQEGTRRRVTRVSGGCGPRISTAYSPSHERRREKSARRTSRSQHWRAGDHDRVISDIEILIRIVRVLPDLARLLRRGHNYPDIVRAIGSTIMPDTRPYTITCVPVVTIFQLARFYRCHIEYALPAPLLLFGLRNIAGLAKMLMLFLMIVNYSQRSLSCSYSEETAGHVPMKLWQDLTSFMAPSYQVLSYEKLAQRHVSGLAGRRAPEPGRGVVIRSLSVVLLCKC